MFIQKSAGIPALFFDEKNTRHLKIHGVFFMIKLVFIFHLIKYQEVNILKLISVSGINLLLHLPCRFQAIFRIRIHHPE